MIFLRLLTSNKVKKTTNLSKKKMTPQTRKLFKNAQIDTKSKSNDNKPSSYNGRKSSRPTSLTENTKKRNHDAMLNQSIGMSRVLSKVVYSYLESERSHDVGGVSNGENRREGWVIF